MPFPFARFWRLVSTVRGCRLFFRERLQAGKASGERRHRSSAYPSPLVIGRYRAEHIDQLMPSLGLDPNQ